MSKMRISIMCVLLSFVVSHVAAMRPSMTVNKGIIKTIINSNAITDDKLKTLELACIDTDSRTVSKILVELRELEALDSGDFQALLKACDENKTTYPNLSECFIQMNKLLAKEPQDYGQETQNVGQEPQEEVQGCCDCLRQSCYDYWYYLLRMCPRSTRSTEGK